MRTFAWVLFFTLMNFVSVSFANTNETLFTVKMVQSEDVEAREATNKTANFKHLLGKAMEVELVRLTGSTDILHQDEAQPMLKQPKKWLKRYRYEAFEQDGVRVGTVLVFEFDKKRFYRYFQQQGLIVWPLTNRPLTLVMGSQLIAGSLVKLDESVLGYIPNFDYRKIGQKFALPVETADSNGRWVYPDSETENIQIPDLMQMTSARFLLSFQVVMDLQGGESLKWQLFDRQGRVLMSEPLKEGAIQTQLNDIFLQLMSYYSAGYREQAQFLGSITLTVNNVNSLDKLTQLETWLTQQKPVLHQSRLNFVTQNQAVFELVYQGDYAKLIDKLATFPGVRLIEDDAIIGKVSMEWVSKPATFE